MKVLILNSDSPNNRGDRAILQGLIALIKDLDPSAKITSLSQFAERDEKWFGIDFLPFSPYSTSPLDYLKLLAAARRSDVILWGGGELLKDYTNKLSLFYWALKLFGVSLANKRVIGAFQGIGPTSANISKWAIVKAVNRCQVFLVRDAESKEKLDAWGTKSEVIASFDPAVYTSFSPSPKKVFGLGLRRWFHYRRGGFLPTKYRFWGKANDQLSPDEITYTNQMVEFADWLTESQDAEIRLIPMHMSASENDAGFAQAIKDRMKYPERVQILASDSLSPDELLEEIGACQIFIASRLHSAILATVANVPSICLYYVDKGRLFFEQIGLTHYSRPIEIMTKPGAVAELKQLAQSLLSDRDAVQQQQRTSLEEMKAKLRADLGYALERVKR